MNGTMFTEKHVALKYRNSMTLLNLVKKKKIMPQVSKTKRNVDLKKKKNRLVVTKGEQVGVEGCRMRWVNCIMMDRN